ncbi:hypothetical protein V8F20_003772 [Naviculisporaceae sp. PSN 640]
MFTLTLMLMQLLVSSLVIINPHSRNKGHVTLPEYLHMFPCSLSLWNLIPAICPAIKKMSTCIPTRRVLFFYQSLLCFLLDAICFPPMRIIFLEYLLDYQHDVCSIPC